MVCVADSVHTPVAGRAFRPVFIVRHFRFLPVTGRSGTKRVTFFRAGGGPWDTPVCVSVLCCIHKKDTCGVFRRYLLTSRVLARESVSVLFYLFSYFVECGERHFHQLHLRLLVAFVAVGFCGRRHVEMNLFAGNPFEQAARFLKREFGMAAGAMRSPWFSTVLPSAYGSASFPTCL